MGLLGSSDVGAFVNEPASFVVDTSVDDASSSDEDIFIVEPPSLGAAAFVDEPACGIADWVGPSVSTSFSLSVDDAPHELTSTTTNAASAFIPKA
jgi:hypothetical protein